MLTLNHILNCYNAYIRKEKYLTSYDVGRYIGYFEAGLIQFNALNIEFGGIKREILVTKKWYRAEVRETVKEAIIRQTEELLESNGLL